MAEHAPGPWSIRGGPPLWYLIEDRDGHHVACVDVPAAAPLVAAAPELHLALVGIVALLEDPRTGDAGRAGALNLARSALATAKRRAP